MEISGKLRKNATGRWEIVGESGENLVLELTSGDVIEVEIGGHWAKTRIEYDHAAGGYYATVTGILLCNGLSARVSAV